MALFRPDEIVALIVAVCFAMGLNVYATVATLGLLARADVIALPDGLVLLENWWVIGASGVLFGLEFVADKIPGVDLVWNVLQTFVRVPAGALLAWTATTELSLGGQALAALAGGLVVLAAHGGKLAIRGAVSASPEPVSNGLLSLVEDALAVGLTWFATQYPWLAAGLALALLVSIVVMVRWVVRVLRAIVGRGTGAAGPGGLPPPAGV
jgi:hypothetical protein